MKHKYLFVFLIFFSLNLNLFSEQLTNTSPSDIISSPYKTNSKGENFTGYVKKKFEIEVYKDGRPHGKWLKFYPNGSLKSIETWNMGKLSGKYTLYRNDETKILENNYLNGKDHGRYLMFHENGVQYITGQFSKGVPIGIWNYYNTNGKLTGKNDFTKNEKKK